MIRDEELSDLAIFLPIDILKDRIRRPTELLPEPVLGLIPSLEIASDGPRLSRLFLVTANFLCDVVIQGTRQQFDYAAIKSIYNYRIGIWDQDIGNTETGIITYEVAEVEFYHNIASGFATSMSYAGHARDAWLKKVTELIPVNTIGDPKAITAA